MQVRFKISIILLFIAIVSGYLVIWLRYYGYLSLNQYVSLTIAVTLVLPALLLLLRNNYPESTYLGINLKKVVWFLPLFLLLSAILELRLLGYMGLFTIVVLVMGLSLLALSKLKGDLTSKASLLLALMICVLYGVYIPSFGNDTWRDVI
ncbi:MAG: hypothetical protein DRO13_05720 [Thermoprotei archaeon]|nr:MAG: hypothetical protein DRO13_05720 [Thermoprotei archaeon]